MNDLGMNHFELWVKGIDWAPDETQEFEPTDVMPGSKAKVEVLTKRVEMGFPLWHPNDRSDFDEESMVPSNGIRCYSESEIERIMDAERRYGWPANGM